MTTCWPMRRRSSGSRRNCARGSTAGCSSPTTCASTTDSSGANSRSTRHAVAQPEPVHGAAVARAVSGDAAAQSRRRHGTSRHRHRKPPSRHAGCAGAAGSSGARCARPGRSTHCRPRSICASLRATLPPALPPDLAGRSSGERRACIDSSDEDDGTAAICQQGEHPARARARSFPGGCQRREIAQARRARCGACEWTETAGELGALLLEAREVRDIQPDVQPAAAGRRCPVHLVVRRRRAAPRLVELDARSPALRATPSAPMRTSATRGGRSKRSRAKTTGASRCWVSRSGPGRCVGLQVGRCNGACVGKEPAALHFARVKLGLMPQRLEPWPHEGPMMLREGAGERRNTTSSTHGSILGSCRCRRRRCDTSSSAFARRAAANDFDIDAIASSRASARHRGIPTACPCRDRDDAAR